MPFGETRPAVLEQGPEGIVGHIVFAIVAIIGGIIGSAGGAATGIVGLFRAESMRRELPTALTPEQAAIAVLKGQADAGEAAAEAALNGVDRGRFDVLSRIAGNPPGPESLLDLLRRGIIDEGRMELGLREGLLRDDWIDTYRARVHDPLSAVQYLQGAVQGYLSEDDAVTRAGQVGVSPEDGKLIYDMLGNPPGVVEMLHLWKRGDVTEDDVDQAIRESHYKNKYIPAIKAYAQYFPPPRTIGTLLAHGAMTTDQANRYYKAAGLSDELTGIYIASALHTKTASHKELAVGTVKALYAQRVLTRDEALADMAKVGYDAPEAELILTLADAEAVAKVKAQAVDQVRALFVTRKITEEKTSEDLTTIGVDHAMIDHLLQLWRLEQATPTKQLTVAQLVKAVKENVLTDAQFVDRVIALGYSPDDARILHDSDFPPATTQGA